MNLRNAVLKECFQGLVDTKPAVYIVPRSGISGVQFAAYVGIKYSTLANWIQDGIKFCWA